jgi:hypothetical protein
MMSGIVLNIGAAHRMCVGGSGDGCSHSEQRNRRYEHADEIEVHRLSAAD